MSKKIVISGYYGFGNFGDEAILYTLIQKLKDYDTDITVISGNPQFTIANYYVKAIKNFALFKLIYAIKSADVLISGGGSLLQDVTSVRSLIYYLLVIWLGILFNKKVIIFAQGIGPIKNKFAFFITMSILKKCTFISVRDINSQNLLKNEGINSELVCDPIYSFPLKKSESANTVGIQLRSFKNLSEELLNNLANQIVKDYTIKGWVMDDERLKNGGSILTEKYFEEQLERIREIRMSERKFYQKITDIYATSIDYDKTAKATIRFFTSVQNKLHYAVSGNTAAEIIYNRADSTKEHMGLTSWEGAPNSKIHKYDVSIAKNYLSEKEIGQLERMVSAYLDLAEMQAMRHIPMTMADWEERLNGFLKLWDHEILKDNGKISAEMAKIHAETEFEKYRVIQDRIYISDFDELLLNTKKLNKRENKQ